MKAYYEENGATIYCADNRDVMPVLSDSIDLLLADPAYGIGANVKGKSSQRNERLFNRLAVKPKDWEDVVGDDRPFDPAPFLSFPEVILFGGNHFCSRLPDSSCWIIWDKRDGGKSDDNADCEIAWTNLKGPARLYRQLWRGWVRAGRESIAISGGKLHPFQKPLGLIKFCLSLSKTSGVVLDPFMGSGTTLLAAKEFGRSAIGIEIDERYCEIAADRLRQGVLSFDGRRFVLPDVGGELGTPEFERDATSTADYMRRIRGG